MHDSTLLQNYPVYNAVILVGLEGNVDVERRSVGKIIADSRRHWSIYDLSTIFQLLMSDYYVMKTETENTLMKTLKAKGVIA